MRFDIVTLFPGMFDAIRDGITGRALERGLIEMHCWNPRDFTSDVHRTVDDRPYGGGPGMVMKVEPLRDAIRAARRESPDSRVVYLSPQGRVLTQQAVTGMSTLPGLILVAGRYEGVDERVLESDIDEEWSVGDYVLSGGELPAMLMIDAITRLIPGALGHALSAEQDSHVDGLLDCPHYTRPVEIDGMQIPDVLRSGNHELIRRWRLQHALVRTRERRPDLLEQRQLNAEETELLKTYIAAQKQQTNEEQ